MQLILLGVAVVAYLVYRVWLAARGEEWKPQGRWVPRTQAAYEYLERTRIPLTRRQKMSSLLTFTLSLAVVGLFLLWVVGQR